MITWSLTFWVQVLWNLALHPRPRTQWHHHGDNTICLDQARCSLRCLLGIVGKLFGTFEACQTWKWYCSQGIGNLIAWIFGNLTECLGLRLAVPQMTLIPSPHAHTSVLGHETKSLVSRYRPACWLCPMLYSWNPELHILDMPANNLRI